MGEKVSVIIPAYNEEKTIEEVINIARKVKFDVEIIVVDNCCTDKTVKKAKKAGAKIVECTNKGKGYAMEAGLKMASNEVVVYLDADIKDYHNNVVELLAEPILKENFDFVKSSFDRTKGGIVTEISTKPLLDFLFPEMYKFKEPLSGMIAGKKSLLNEMIFEKDYGVDIGILIDATNMKLNIKEVNIGKIENMSHLLKTTESMRKMSTEIMKAILKRVNYIEVR